MKLLLPASVFLLVAATVADADVYIKHESRTDEYYYGGVVHPAENDVAEVWIGDKKFSYITPNRTIIIDVDKNVLFFVNRRDSSYAEAALPAKLADLAVDDLAALLGLYETHGEVKDAGESRKIGEWNCKAYNVNSWMIYEGSRAREREANIWYTTDLPLNWAAFDEMYGHFQGLNNNAAEYLGALLKIKGYPVLSEEDHYIKGFSVKTIEKIVELEERIPPEGVYSVPAGFTRKEKLTMDDIR
jgi:hypothetical protein